MVYTGHATSGAMLILHLRTTVGTGRAIFEMMETLIMQRWRYIRFTALALVLMAAPGWLQAQEEPAKAAAPAAAAPGATAAPAPAPEFHWFAFATDPSYTIVETIALWVVLLVAIAGLVYAGTLVNQVIGADEGTERMREVGAAIRQGANAYLARQFKAIFLADAGAHMHHLRHDRVDSARWRWAGRLPSSWGRPSPGWSASWE